MKRTRCVEWLIYVVLINVAIGLLFELCFLPSYISASKVMSQEVIDDNEFAEFEEVDDDSDEFIQPKEASTPQPAPLPTPDKPNTQSQYSSDFNSDEIDGLVEEEDEDEFEIVREESDEQPEKPFNENTKTEDLKITKIPLHLRANWESYYLEFLIMFSLVVYFINFITGRNKNFYIANTWFEMNQELLDFNFALVGDDGKKEIEQPGLLKETENVYTLWCSGRSSIDGLLAEIQLVKRQDLFSLILNYFKPINDRITIRIQLSSDSLDNFVFCIVNKKHALRLSKEMNDLSTFCPERKSPEKYGVRGENYQLLNEIGEAASFILDAKVISLLNKNEDLVEYIHISDQFSGIRNTEETQSSTKLPDVKKMLIASFNLPSNSSRNLDELERMKPLLQMLFYIVDKTKRFRLSRESKAKSEKNRQKVEKLFLQSTHFQRQELAQLKREERRRQEKERMLQEMDPDKQRKWEEKEYKRELKRKTPKMKQLKVKAM